MKLAVIESSGLLPERHATGLRAQLALWRPDTPLLLCAALLALTLAVLEWGGPGLQRSATEILIRLVMVVGMYIFIGHSGIISFGHVAFVGIGAYAAAWVTMEPEIKQYVLTGLPQWMAESAWHWLPAAGLGGALAAGVALVAGAVILRLTGIAAAIATFSLLAIFNVVYSNWDSVTAGTSSIVGIPTPIEAWQALAMACAAIVVAHGHAVSRWGLALRAVREEPIAARASGINGWRMALVAFVLSALVCGVGGALDAQSLGVVNPDAYYLGRTFICLAMLVVGGVTSLSGAVTGVVVLSLLTEMLRALEGGVELAGTSLQIPAGMQEITLGLVMIAVLIRRPGGLLGHHEVGWLHGAPRSDRAAAGGTEPRHRD